MDAAHAPAGSLLYEWAPQAHELETVEKGCYLFLGPHAGLPAPFNPLALQTDATIRVLWPAVTNRARGDNPV